jgi:hypothetical protein
MTFDFGDWSNDGHGRTEIVDLVANHPADEIAKAYHLAAKKVGFKFHADVAHGYGDRSFPAQKFLDMGMKREDVAYENDSDGEPEEWTVGWVEHMVLLLEGYIKQALPDLELKIADRENRPANLRAQIAGSEQFGYGMFD